MTTALAVSLREPNVRTCANVSVSPFALSQEEASDDIAISASPGSVISTSRSKLFADLVTLRKDARVRVNSVQMSEVTSPSASDSVSGLLSVTASIPVRPSALNTSTYARTPHNQLPQNKMEENTSSSMFSMAHLTTPGSAGHF
jgi:hypothetical protein